MRRSATRSSAPGSPPASPPVSAASSTRASASSRPACGTATIPTPTTRSSPRSTRRSGSTATTPAASTSSPAATVRRSCSRTASRSRRACGRSSSTRSPRPASAPSRSTGAATASPPSATPATRSTTSPTTCAACSKRLDLRDAVLVGHSMGGMAVQAFAIRHPDIARERVLGHRAAVHRRAQPSPATRAACADGSSASPARSRTSARSCASATSACCSRAWASATRRTRATSRRRARCSPRARARPCATRRARCSRSTSHPGLPSITLPTLVLVGTADVLTPPRDARQIATLIPDAEPGGVPGRRAHAHVRARRRGRRAHHRLRARLRTRDGRRCGAAARLHSDHRRPRRPRRALDRRRRPASPWSCSHPTPSRRVEIRGGAPATRGDRAARTAVAPSSTSTRSCSSGGSAFGLATADGVMRALAEPAAASRPGVGRCRSCPRPRSSTSSRPGGVTPGPEEGRAALAAALAPSRRYRSRSGGWAPAAARRSASGGAASTRCPVGSVRRARATATSWSARSWS